LDFPRNDFWDFTLEAHGKKGVHEACLHLQREYELDINVLFFCCWVGASGAGALARERMRRIVDETAGWQESVVRPVWRARWKLKNGCGDYPRDLVEALRKDLVRSEVDAERIEQLHLASLAPDGRHTDKPWEKRLGDTLNSLREYLVLVMEGSSGADEPAGQVTTEDFLGPLTVILGAAFPQMPPGQVKNQVGRFLDL